MEKEYILLSPIASTTLRLTFGIDNQFGNAPDPYEIMKPTILQFGKFAINRFFWFIVNLKNWTTIYGGGELEKMTPLKKEDFFGGSHQQVHDITYAPDLNHVNAFSKFWVNLYLSLPFESRAHFKVSMYFRIMNAEHEYYWIMVHYSDTIVNNDGMIVYGLVFVTDISHLKKDGEPMMTILNTYDGNSQQFFCTNMENLVEKKTPGITAREREILYYLMHGLSSKQIAAQLNIAVKTVDNHRQNMLHRMECRSTAELIACCIKSNFC